MRKRYRYDAGTDAVVEVAASRPRPEIHAVRCPSYEFKVWSQEPYAPGFDHYDTDGQPIITAKKQIHEACAKGDLRYGDSAPYDFQE